MATYVGGGGGDSGGEVIRGLWRANRRFRKDLSGGAVGREAVELEKALRGWT